MNITNIQFRDVSGYTLREIYRWRQYEMIPNTQSTINIVHTFARIGQWSNEKRNEAVELMLELRKQDYAFRKRKHGKLCNRSCDYHSLNTAASVVSKVMATEAAF